MNDYLKHSFFLFRSGFGTDTHCNHESAKVRSSRQTTRVLSLFAWVASMGLIGTTSLQAQAAEEPILELEPIVVRPGVDEKRFKVFFHLSVDTSGADLTITGDNLRDHELLTIEDAFRNVPGVYVRSQFTGTSQARIIIRGFGLSGTPPTRGVRLIQDGMPMTLPDGHFLPQNIDYRIIESIDVYRGSTSLYQSAGTLGGALNFETYTPNNSPVLRIRGEAGSYGNFRAHASYATKFKTGDALIAATHANQEGYRLQNHEDAQFFNANTGWQLSDTSDLRLYLTYTDVEGELSGPLSINQFKEDPRSVSLSQPFMLRDLPFRDIKVSRAGLRYKNATRDSELELAAWVLYSDYRVFRPRATEGLDFLSTAPGIRGQYTVSSEWGKTIHVISIGGELFVESRPTKRAELNAGEAGNIIADHDMKSGMAILTISDKIYLSKQWAIEMSLQPQRHWRKVEENLNGAGLNEVDFSNTADVLSSRVEVSWSLDKRLNLWGAISSQEEIPILDDLVGASSRPVAGQKRLYGVQYNNLDSQEAWTIEVGARGDWQGLLWDITYYRSSLSNEIIRTRPPEGPDVTRNADGDTIHQGVEFLGEISIIKGAAVGDPAKLSWVTTVNFSDFHFDGDPDFGDSNLPAVPLFMIQSELLGHVTKEWYIGLSMESVPDGMYVDYANTMETDGYTLFGLRAGRKVSRGWSGFVSVENLFDESFVNSVAPQSGLNSSLTNMTAALFSGQGRRWQLGLEYKF